MLMRFLLYTYMHVIDGKSFAFCRHKRSYITSNKLKNNSIFGHSHSIVLGYRSALIWLRKFFLRTRKNRLPDPSEICALDFKREFG
jgi:hypothetical protein